MNGKAFAVAGAVAIATVIIGGGVWFGVNHFLVGDDAAAVDAVTLSAAAEAETAALVAQVRAGGVLYMKAIGYTYIKDSLGPGRPGLSGSLPNTVVTEMWLAANDRGYVGRSAGTARAADGTLLQYSYGRGNSLTITDIASGKQFGFEDPTRGVTLTEWLEYTMTWPIAYLKRDIAIAGRGRLDVMEPIVFDHRLPDGRSEGIRRISGIEPRETVVFEQELPAETTELGELPKKWIRLEFVADAPLLSRQDIYEIDDAGQRTLLLSHTTTHYEVLPPGTELPAFAGTGNQYAHPDDGGQGVWVDCGPQLEDDGAGRLIELYCPDISPE